MHGENLLQNTDSNLIFPPYVLSPFRFCLVYIFRYA